MKNYTDIEQSKKLAEILPHESADMWWAERYEGHITADWEYIVADTPNFYISLIKPSDNNFSQDTIKDIPCWSLATLLELLPNEISTDNSFVNHYQIDIRKHDWYDNTTLYQIAYGNDRGSSGEWSDMINTGQKENLIDCCVQMILKLHEFKMV